MFLCLVSFWFRLLILLNQSSLATVQNAVSFKHKHDQKHKEMTLGMLRASL